jgi:predicted enzyme related to lactoylglutathione lyase
MSAIERVLYNILSSDIGRSASFYRQLGNFEQIYTSDWYIVLAVPDHVGFQLGIIAADSEYTPAEVRGRPAGGYLTLVVDDVHAAVERARAMQAEIIREPVALGYGQTQALVRDPDGNVVDISTPTEKLAR